MTPAQAAWFAAHDRGPCTYVNCMALVERDWLLAQASDDVREFYFAIQAAEEARVLALQPIEHTHIEELPCS